MMTAPITHWKQPTLPTKLRRSLRNIADNTVVMTTLRAPKGVTRIASTYGGIISAVVQGANRTREWILQRRRPQNCKFHCRSVSLEGYNPNLAGQFSPYDHQDHSSPPPPVFEVAVALARSLVVFLVRFEQSMLFQYERCTNKETGAYGKNNTNCLIYRRSRGVVFACFGACSIGSICPSVQVVGCEQDMAGRIHAV